MSDRQPRTFSRRGFLKIFGIGAAAAITGEAARRVTTPPAAKAGGPDTLIPQAYLPFVSQTDNILRSESSFGKGSMRVGLAYPDKTNLNDPEVSARVKEDIAYVESLVNIYPIFGNPTAALAAHYRYKYDFSIGPTLGRYNKSYNQLYISVENGPSPFLEHIILHETAHFADSYNTDNIARFMPQETYEKARIAREQLLKEVGKYSVTSYEEYEKLWNANDILEQKIANKQPVALQEIIDGANAYPADVWRYPEGYIQFKDGIDRNKVKERADDELYADFTAYLLRSQRYELLKESYEHPVLKIFWEVKNKYGGQQPVKTTESAAVAYRSNITIADVRRQNKAQKLDY